MASIERNRPYARRNYSWTAYGGSRAALEMSVGEAETAPFWSMVVRRQTALILVLCATLFLFGIFTLTQVAEGASISKRVGKNKVELSELTARNDLLQGEVNELSSATRIRSLALNKLEMVEPAVVVAIDVAPEIAQTKKTNAETGQSRWVVGLGQ